MKKIIIVALNCICILPLCVVIIIADFFTAIADKALITRDKLYEWAYK